VAGQGGSAEGRATVIHDRSIVARFHPDGVFRPPQYLRRESALFTEEEWIWANERSAAHVFPSHAEAEKEAKNRAYQDAAGKWHTPWALVLGGDVARREQEQRERGRACALEAQVEEIGAERQPKPLKERVAIARKAAATRKARQISPEEAYSRTQRLLGEHD
jgi:hypothetical protein